jgi:hypothetical protein
MQLAGETVHLNIFLCNPNFIFFGQNLDLLDDRFVIKKARSGPAGGRLYVIFKIEILIVDWDEDYPQIDRRGKQNNAQHAPDHAFAFGAA